MLCFRCLCLCRSCEPGFSVQCRPCAKNTYQSQPAKISCLPCPPRRTTLGKTGSISRSNCSGAADVKFYEKNLEKSL